MDDLISRQAAIDALVKIDLQVYEGGCAVGRRDYMTKEEARTIIERLPSAQPTQSNAVQHVESVESVGDCISRRAAIDVMLMAIDDDWEPDYATDRMNELPSAQPEPYREEGEQE